MGAALPLMDLPSPGTGAVGPDGSAPTLTFPIAASSLSSSNPNVNSCMRTGFTLSPSQARSEGAAFPQCLPAFCQRRSAVPSDAVSRRHPSQQLHLTCTAPSFFPSSPHPSQPAVKLTGLGSATSSGCTELCSSALCSTPR